MSKFEMIFFKEDLSGVLSRQMSVQGSHLQSVTGLLEQDSSLKFSSFFSSFQYFPVCFLLLFLFGLNSKTHNQQITFFPKGVLIYKELAG